MLILFIKFYKEEGTQVPIPHLHRSLRQGKILEALCKQSHTQALEIRYK